MPRPARVVAWEPANAQSALDLAQLSELKPILTAGFEIDAILSPAEALADLVRARQVDTTSTPVAAVSLNSRGAALAIVSDGTLIASRSFEWPLGRPFRLSRPELLERYLLVAQLAPQIQHLIELVRPVYGARVSSVLVSGTLPDLRSLAMLLTEEMDIEVETLDSPDLVEPNLSGGGDDVAALQLAAAAATETVAGTFPAKVPATITGGRTPTLAVLALALVAAWSYLQLAGIGQAIPLLSLEQAAVLAAGKADIAPVPSVTDLRIEATIGRIGDTLASPAAPPVAPTAAAAPPPEPVASTPPRPPSLPRVDGVVISATRSLAIVDGNVVALGDRVGSRTVARIDRDGVVLRESSGSEIYVAIRARKPVRGPAAP
jgi:hypothetical protein